MASENKSWGSQTYPNLQAAWSGSVDSNVKAVMVNGEKLEFASSLQPTR